MTIKAVCSSCSGLSQQVKVVVGRGNPKANILIVGEAPGAEENKFGLPFVGRAGKLLDKLLIKSNLDPHLDTYMCNIVKCRPPKNRKPLKSEIANNMPWLYQQIELIEPFIIVLTGATAVEALLGIKSPMNSLRGTWQNWEGKLVMPVFHPSYLLRNPSSEKGKPLSLTTSDFLKVKKKLLQLLS